MREMATFSQWLGGHEAGAQDDPVAWLARQWKALEGNRPRVSSPSGIEKHLMTLAAGEPAQQDQWTGYVHTAVAEATSRYKQVKLAEQAGSSTSSGEGQKTLSGTAPGYPADDPGMNPATGKPVAVVGQAQWRNYPSAQEWGSCTECGWARGIADMGQGEQMMCAAGHVFVPQRPDPTGDAGQGATTSPAGTAASAAGEQVRPVVTYNEQTGEAFTTLSGPLTPVVGAGGAGPGVMTGSDPEHDAVYEQAAADAAEHVTDEQPIDLLGLLNLKLDAILISLGLPTGMYELATLLATPLDDGMLSAQLRAETGELAAIPPEPGSTASGLPVPPFGPQVASGLPPDFAAWYGIADPEATEQ